MGSYVPSTQAERQEMLEAIGLKDYQDLYRDVPQTGPGPPPGPPLRPE